MSPHSADPTKFQQRYGSEIKLAEGLNGLDLDAWYDAFPDDKTDFMYRYVVPALPQCVGSKHKNCANCLPYALDWRRRLLAKLPTRWQDAASANALPDQVPLLA